MGALMNPSASPSAMEYDRGICGRPPEDPSPTDPVVEQMPLLAGYAAASIQKRVATGAAGRPSRAPPARLPRWWTAPSCAAPAWRASPSTPTSPCGRISAIVITQIAPSRSRGSGDRDLGVGTPVALRPLRGSQRAPGSGGQAPNLHAAFALDPVGTAHRRHDT
jgi:hypothetical protein